MRKDNPAHAYQLQALIDIAKRLGVLPEQSEQLRIGDLGLKIPEMNARWKIQDQYIRIVGLANEKSRYEPLTVVFQAKQSGDVFTMPLEKFIERMTHVADSVADEKGRAGLFVDPLRRPEKSKDIAA